MARWESNQPSIPDWFWQAVDTEAESRIGGGRRM